WCIDGPPLESASQLEDGPDAKTCHARPDLRASSLLARDYRAMCSLVHHLPAELSRSGRDDGGARDRRVPHDDHALGVALRARVRTALVAVRAIAGIVLAHG